MRNLLFILFIITLSTHLSSQEELEWQETVDDLVETEHEMDNDKKGLVLLTGSSSARMWKSFSEVVPEYNSINNGFGGSQMHELLFYLDKLVLNYKPDKVLIYEGDNDINAGKTSESIIETTREVVNRIKAALPNCEIYLISPKPSISRWELASKYEELNSKMKSYCETEEMVTFIDVWKPMLNEDGEPLKDIFISDNLHMNEKGYKIWKEVVGPIVN